MPPGELQSLHLEVADYVSPDQWRWCLSTPDGEFVEDHEVRLDAAAIEHEGFRDLEAFIRWNQIEEENPTSNRQLLSTIATWIREEVWGAVGNAILDAAETAPVVVHVLVPPNARALLFRPLELAFTYHDSPAALDVSLVYDVTGGTEKPAKRPVEDKLRFLALFSMPTDQHALDVGRERRALRRLIQQVTQMAGRAVEIRTLQYGVTRERLEEVLEEGEGWDLIHFSGHGLPNGLVLETDTGGTDIIESREFVELLRTARSRIKLVVLSSCDSGAAKASAAMQMLGLEATGLEAGETEGQDGGTALPAVAQGLADEMGCGVLAMRYPVDDDFAIDMAREVYEGLLINGQQLTRSLQRALKRSLASDNADRGLSRAAPALFGTASLGLELTPPARERDSFDPNDARLPYFDPEPKHFVGRVGPLTRASKALAPRSSFRGVLFHGMAGAGKTACALELAYGHQERRFEGMAWFKAPSEGEEIQTALGNFAVALENQLDGFELIHVVNDRERLEKFLPRLRSLLAERSLLIVIDNLESLLTETGEWRDERWRMLSDTLISHDGLSRVVLTSRRQPKNLQDHPALRIESINSLSANESALLARQLPHLGRLMSDDSPVGQPDGLRLVRRTLEIVQGSPKLIQLADSQARDVEALQARIREADETWVDTLELKTFFETGRPDDQIGAADFLQVLERWTSGIASSLQPEERLAFQFLCSIEPTDRTEDVVSVVWPQLWRELGREDPPPDVRQAVEAVGREGLTSIEVQGSLRFFAIHPAVEHAERQQVETELFRAISLELSRLWISQKRKAQDEGQSSWMATAALSGVPYLLRLGEVGAAANMLATAVMTDLSAQQLASTVPQLERALEMVQGATEQRRVKHALLRARFAHRSQDVFPGLRELAEQAREEGDYAQMGVILTDLYNALTRAGRLKDAREVAEEQPEVTRRAGLGPWSQLADEGIRLQAMLAAGEKEKVLVEAQKLRARMDETPLSSDLPEVAAHWNVREGILDAGFRAAAELGEAEEAFKLLEAVEESERARNARPIEMAKTAYNRATFLIVLDQLDSAETILRTVRQAVEAAGDRQMLARVLGTGAELADKRGRIQEAIKFQRRALHLNYDFGEPELISATHHHLANYLLRAGQDSVAAFLHRLAATLIGFQIGSRELKGELASLFANFNRRQSEEIPSYETFCAALKDLEGVDFKAFFAKLPSRADPPDAYRTILEALARAAENASGADEPPPSSSGS